MFDFNPMEPGNLMTVGMIEEDQINRASAAYDYLWETCGQYCTVEDIDNALAEYDVDYLMLPQYAKDWFNEFDLPD